MHPLSRMPGYLGVLSRIGVQSQAKWLQAMARSSMAMNGNSCLWIGEFEKEEFLLTLLWLMPSLNPPIASSVRFSA